MGSKITWFSHLRGASQIATVEQKAVRVPCAPGELTASVGPVCPLSPLGRGEEDVAALRRAARLRGDHPCPSTSPLQAAPPVRPQCGQLLHVIHTLFILILQLYRCSQSTYYA